MEYCFSDKYHQKFKFEFSNYLLNKEGMGVIMKIALLWVHKLIYYYSGTFRKRFFANINHLFVRPGPANIFLLNQLLYLFLGAKAPLHLLTLNSSPAQQFYMAPPTFTKKFQNISVLLKLIG